MLEIGRTYPKPELSQIFGTKDKQGLDRKLIRYGIVFDVCGRGERATYTIKAITDPFKVFAITELGFDGNTDFTKLRNFYYHFFEDDIFMAWPDEVKEVRMREMGQWLSKYGESVFETEGGIWKPTADYAACFRENTVYLHILKNGEQIALSLPMEKNRLVDYASMTGETVQLQVEEGRLVVRVEGKQKDCVDTVIKLSLAERAVMEE